MKKLLLVSLIALTSTSAFAGETPYKCILEIIKNGESTKIESSVSGPIGERLTFISQDQTNYTVTITPGSEISGNSVNVELYKQIGTSSSHLILETSAQGYVIVNVPNENLVLNCHAITP